MYAGFWRRFAAYLIDSLILSIAILVIMVLLGIPVGLSGAAMGMDETVLMGIFSAFGWLIILIMLLLPWLYYALFESSKKQATPGKMALGIKVIKYDGDRVSFGRATGRYFAKILSYLIFWIGYIMAGFTKRKQALHDMIAETFVVTNNYNANP